MRTSPTTLPLVKGRIDTIIDRLDTLYFGSKNPTFHHYRVRLDGIRTQLNACGSTVPAPLATDMVKQLDSLQNDLPRAYDAVAARGMSSGEFGHDWAAAYPEIVQYITFIANRVPEISSLPPPTMTSARAAAPVIPAANPHAAAPAHYRQPSTTTTTAAALGRTASYPASVNRAQAQHAPAFMPPPPEYLHGPSAAPRTVAYAVPPPVARGRSMPQIVVPAANYNAAGHVTGSSRSPTAAYPAAPVPPHLAHLYARSPVLGARY